MDLNNLKQQMESAKKLVEETKTQSRIFEQILQETVKGVDESQKAKIAEVQLLAKKAINLAKQGKGEEAQSLIKTFKHGG